MTQTRETRMLDIRAPENVEVVISEDGKTLWVNIDGMCILRCVGTKVDLNNFHYPVKISTHLSGD